MTITVDSASTAGESLYSPMFLSTSQLPPRLIDEVAPGLFQGGTPDEDWRSRREREALPQPTRDLAVEDSIDAVVTLFRRAQPWGLAATEFRYGFPDAKPTADELARVLEAARWAHAHWTADEQVLIRCQAGLNRSGLVTALVLMLEGASASEAIRTIRAARADIALCNNHFVDWLATEADRALARPRPAASRAISAA